MRLYTKKQLRELNELEKELGNELTTNKPCPDCGANLVVGGKCPSLICDYGKDK